VGVGGMNRGAALRQLSALLLHAGKATADHCPRQAASSGQCIRSIATHAAASHGADSSPPAAPAATAAPQHAAAAGGGGGDGGARSMGPVLLLPAAVAAGLGGWQLARRAEKQQQLDDRLSAMRVRICFPLHQRCVGSRLFARLTCTAQPLRRRDRPESDDSAGCAQ
jgi:hypothetical protein